MGKNAFYLLGMQTQKRFGTQKGVWEFLWVFKESGDEVLICYINGGISENVIYCISNRNDKTDQTLFFVRVRAHRQLKGIFFESRDMFVLPFGFYVFN